MNVFCVTVSPPAPGARFECGDVVDKRRARNLATETERRLGNERLDVLDAFGRLRFSVLQTLQTEQSAVLYFHQHADTERRQRRQLQALKQMSATGVRGGIHAVDLGGRSRTSMCFAALGLLPGAAPVDDFLCMRTTELPSNQRRAERTLMFFHALSCGDPVSVNPRN